MCPCSQEKWVIHLTYKGTTVGDRHRQLSHQHIRAGRISGLGTHRPELCAIVRDLGGKWMMTLISFSPYTHPWTPEQERVPSACRVDLPASMDSI